MCGAILIVFAIFLLLPAAAEAEIGIGTVKTAAGDNTSVVNILSVNISGSNRALVVAVFLNDNDDQHPDTVIIDPSGVNIPLTWLDSAYGSYEDDGYCAIFGVVNPPTGTFTVQVTLTAATQSGEGLIAGAWPLTGVDQANPFRTAVGNEGMGNSMNVTVTSEIGDIVLGAGFLEGYNGSRWLEGSDTEDWDLEDGPLANDVSVGQHKGGAATSTTLNWTYDSYSEKWVAIGVAVRPAKTTIGDGTSPANKDVAPDSTNNAVDAFTLYTNSTGTTDTVTALTVTFSGTAAADVATNGVKIYDDSTGGTPNEWDAGDTLKGTASFSGTTADVTVSIPVDDSATQYLVTYDIATGATATNTLGAITAATVSNILVNNDTTDATLTVSMGDAMTTTVADGIWSGSQRYCHYANGYYWIVFYDGTNPVIFSSSDGSIWNSQGDITADHTHEVEQAADIAVRFSGTNMIAVFSDSSSDGNNGSDGYNDIFYRKATLNNDGTVTWWPTSTDHEAANEGSHDEYLFTAFDSENKPWIGGSGSGEEDVNVSEGSALESPSWTLRESTAVAGDNGSAHPTGLFPIADTGDMYFIQTVYYSSNKDLWGIGWDQSASVWVSWALIVDADLYGASDDRIILRNSGERIWMYGTPWHGDAGFASPERAPLTRIYFLKKGQKNALHLKRKAEAVERLFTCSFSSFYRTEAIDFSLGFLGKVAKAVPCCELSFVPDKRVIEFIQKLEN